jgi:diamine N-acetyltransferase
MESPKVETQAVISLREVTSETVRQVCKLSDTLSPSQQKMVASNAYSIAQAHFEKHAWFRAVYAEDDPVGFVMLYNDPEADHVYLWRFMIAGPHQKKGYGRHALQLVFEHALSRPNAHSIKASYVPAEGGAGPFYRKLGFEPTGEMDGEEIVIRRPLR